MRRSLALFLALPVLLLGACGDDDETTTGSPSSPDDVVSTTVDPGDADGTVPDLTVNDDPTAVKCSAPPEGTVDATALVGMSLEDATREAEAEGCAVREVARDGEGLPATQDFRPDRINVATENGEVTEIIDLG